MAAGRTLGSPSSITWLGGPKDFSSGARKAWVESTVSNVKTDEAPQLGVSGNYFVHSSVRHFFFLSRSISSSSKTRGGVFEWAPLCNTN